MNKNLRIVVYSCILLHLSLNIYEFTRIPYITAPDYFPSYNMRLSNFVYEFITKSGIIKYTLFLIIALSIDYDFSVETNKPINDLSDEHVKFPNNIVQQASSFIDTFKAFISVFLFLAGSSIMEFSFVPIFITSIGFYFFLYFLYFYMKYFKIVLFAAYFILSIINHSSDGLKSGKIIKNDVLPSEIRDFLIKNGFKLAVTKIDGTRGYNIAVTNYKNEVKVIIYNQTLELLNKGELISVLYHEIGHVMHSDVFNRIIAFVSLQMLVFLSEFFMIKHSKKLIKKGCETKNLIMLYMLLSITFLPLNSCAINFFTYNAEINADRFSVSHAPKKYLESALTKLNAGNYIPHDSSWLYNVMYIDHPTLTRRLEIIKDL